MFQKQIIDDLTLISFLGKGAFGEVYLSTKINSNKFYATKKISRKIADKPRMKRYLDYERNILRNLNHPNIVKLEDFKTTSNNYYIVMEYINGGELSKCLEKYKEKYQKGFPEKIVQHLMKQIVDALAYLHDLNIIHRDLKLANIMVNFDNEKDKAELNMMKAKIKIIDFGFSIQLPYENPTTDTFVGTVGYMDPKILEIYYNQAKYDGKGYGKEVDIWSLGCLCYELFLGKMPFEANSEEEIYEKIIKGKYKIPKTASYEIVDFFTKMLKYNAKSRLSARELLKHPFLTKIYFDLSDIEEVDSIDISKEKQDFGGHAFNIKDSLVLYYERMKEMKKKKNNEQKMTIIEEDSNQVQNVPFSGYGSFLPVNSIPIPIYQLNESGNSQFSSTTQTNSYIPEF